MTRGDEVLQAITSRASRASGVEIWDRTRTGVLVRRDVITSRGGVRLNRFESVHSTGGLFFDTGNGFASIDTTIGDDSGGTYSDKVESTPYRLRVAPDGSRRFHPRRNRTDEYIDFGPPELGDGASRFQRIDFGSSRARSTPSRLVFTAPGVALVVDILPERVKVGLVFSAPSAAPYVRFPFALNGLDLNPGGELVSRRDGTKPGRFPVPVVKKSGVFSTPWDRLSSTIEPDFVLSDTSLVVRVDWSSFVLPADFPVVVDPTVDVSIGGGGNDGWASPGFYLDTSSDTALFGYDGGSIYTWARFTGVTVPNAATITAAYETVTANDDFGDGSTRACLVCCVDADNPAAPTTIGEADGWALTSGASWTCPDFTSPFGQSIQTSSIVTPVQAVVNRAGWASGNALIVTIKQNYTGATWYRQVATYEHSTQTEPALHIEYATAATGPGPIWIQP